MAANIPGLNEKMYRQMMQNQPQSINYSTPTRAEQEYYRYRSSVSPIMKKMTWPSIIATTLADPVYSRAILEKTSPNFAKTIGESSTGALGTIGGLGYLIPKVLSEGMKSRRLAYEKSFSSKLGAAGSASRALDNLNTLKYLMTLPGYLTQTLGLGQTLLKHTPRPEQFLTGTVGNAIKHGTGGKAIVGGGILNSLYGGVKSGADFLSGGNISSLLASATKKGGVAGTAASGVGLLDKGISSLLSSPTGVMLGITAAQIGLSIYKSIKLAKLQPNRQPPDKFARRFYSPTSSQTAIGKVLALAGTGKVDPQTLSFMVQQIQLSELQRLNMQLAGFRGEYHSENDYVRQEKDKGTSRSFDLYGREILGEDDRSNTSKFLDWMESKLSTVKSKYDPITQLSNFVFGLFRGKLVLPKHETSRIADAYGYSSEKEMIKERSAKFGMSTDQTRLLHTTSKSIVDMAPTYESKVLEILSASFDIQRLSAAELVTIRTGGFGLETNVLYTKDKSVFSQLLSSIAEKLNPMNLPGINAIWNVTKGLAKFAFKTLPSMPEKMYDLTGKASRKVRDVLFGSGYNELKDEEALRKEAGLEVSGKDRAEQFVYRGLPVLLSEVRSVLWSQLEVQQNMYEVLRRQLEIYGEFYKYEEKFADQKQLLVWDANERRWLTVTSAQKSDQGKLLAMRETREHEFRKGLLGKAAFAADWITSLLTPGKKLSDTYTLDAALRRQAKTERSIGGLEKFFTGARETFQTEEIAKQANYPLNSLMSREARSMTSMEEEEEKRKLSRMPTSVPWMLGRFGAGAGMTMLPLLAMLMGGVATGGMGLLAGAGAGGLYGLIKMLKMKKITGQREEEIESTSERERRIFQITDFVNKSIQEQAAEQVPLGADEMPFGQTPVYGREVGANGVFSILISQQDEMINQLKELSTDKIDIMIDRLTTIRDYLGNERGSIYELLEPGPRIAEVTIVDQDGHPIFIGTGGSSQMAALYDIRDYLGGKENSISNLLDPSQPNVVEFKMANAKAEGGPIDKNKPVLVGEQGPEILMPRSAGVIIPNDEIDKFANCGLLKGDIFVKIYEKLNDMFKLDREMLDVETNRDKKREKDEREMTMIEKLRNLKERTQTKLAQFVPKKLDTFFKSRFSKRSSTSDSGGFFGGILDFFTGGAKALSGLGSNLLGFILNNPAIASTIALGISGLLAKILWWDNQEESTKENIKTRIKDFLLEKFNEMSVPGLAGVGAGVGALAGSVGGIPGILAGTIVGASIGLLIGSLRDSFKEYESSGGDILSGFQQFLTGSVAGEYSNIGGNAAKFAIMGGAIGAVAGAAGGAGVGAIPGFFIGTLIGGTLGAAISWFKNIIVEADKTGTTTSVIPKFFLDMHAEIIAMFNEITPLGGRFAQYGAFTVPIIGPLVGGIVGTVIGGILQIFGGMATDFEVGRMLRDKIKKDFPKLYNFFFEKDGGVETQENVRIRLERERKQQHTKKLSNASQLPGGSLTTPSQVNPSNLAINAAPGILELMQTAASRAGVPIDWLLRIAKIESNFQPGATNPKGSSPQNAMAAGIFQFIPDTWKNVVLKFGPKYGLDSSWASPEKRIDPYANIMMGAELIGTYPDALRNAGINDITFSDLYSVHMMGRTDFAKAVRSNPNVKMMDLIKQIYSPNRATKILTNNPQLKTEMVGDYFNNIQSKAGDFVKGVAKSVISKGKELTTNILGPEGVDTAKDVVKRTVDIFEILGSIGKDIGEALMKAVFDDYWKQNLTIGGFGQPDDMIPFVKDVNSMKHNIENRVIQNEIDRQREEERVKKMEEISVRKAKALERTANELSSVGKNPTQSLPRPIGSLGTSITPEVDELISQLFNHTILNDLNKSYPKAYLV